MTTKQSVAVKLQTVIYDNGDKEDHTIHATGTFYPGETMDVLTYEETLEEGLAVSNMLTLNDEKVSIKRSGPMSMHQQFRQPGITENVYQHPHGHIHMETFTHSIRYERPTSGQNGKVTIDYNVKLNGADERRHQLTLWIRPKEDAQ